MAAIRKANQPELPELKWPRFVWLTWAANVAQQATQVGWCQANTRN